MAIYTLAKNICKIHASIVRLEACTDSRAPYFMSTKSISRVYTIRYTMFKNFNKKVYIEILPEEAINITLLAKLIEAAL